LIEKNFDISFIADLALREKQVQQNYRPLIAVHKWFARRPGTLFRGLLLSEFVSQPLRDSFYATHNLSGTRIADPFMGGGTPLLEANRLGSDVIGYDINPMAYWIVREEIAHLDLKAYRAAAIKLRATLEERVGDLYRTKCLQCDSTEAHAKSFLWVKVQSCKKCTQEIDIFPGYLLSEDKRHPKNVVVCAACGELTECEDRKSPGPCAHCGSALSVNGPAKRGTCPCPHCGEVNRVPDPSAGTPRHRMFAIEYYCPACKTNHKGRFFKKPDPADLIKCEQAEERWRMTTPQFTPDDEIPSGDETDRLHRWGYERYAEMFNARQLLGLETSCSLISQEKNERIRAALATNLSDLLRYQNMLCRYDTMALKSLDIFSVHGFPVGLIQCESNILGIQNGSSEVSVGSGGWSNIIEKYAKAKAYCDDPFEVRHEGKRKIKVPIEGEWIGESKNGHSPSRQVMIYCGDATLADIPPQSLDAVLTDPPYFGNVQYAELMDFCYVWLRRLIGDNNPSFSKETTRHSGELTGNDNMNRGLEHFTEGLSVVFEKMTKALKPGAPLAFTYHHNKLEAYYPLAVAVLDSGFVCSASLPCPAEMGASIHINGTDSSIIDTVFVCRAELKARSSIVKSPSALAEVVREDLEKLCAGNVTPTRGDIRCIIYGHLIRLAIWHLHRGWERSLPTAERIVAVARFIEAFGGLSSVEKYFVGAESVAARESSGLAASAPV
jgi:adenine-specific DNA methylase